MSAASVGAGAGSSFPSSSEDEEDEDVEAACGRGGNMKGAVMVDAGLTRPESAGTKDASADEGLLCCRSSVIG